MYDSSSLTVDLSGYFILARQHCAQHCDLHYSIVLLDLSMPGLDGELVCFARVEQIIDIVSKASEQLHR